MSQEINIRTIGAYEIVILDTNKKRILERVFHEGLFGAEREAIKLVESIPEASSYWVSKIIYNSLFTKWSPNNGR